MVVATAVVAATCDGGCYMGGGCYMLYVAVATEVWPMPARGGVTMARASFATIVVDSEFN